MLYFNTNVGATLIRKNSRRSRGSSHGWVRTCDRFAFPISLSRSTMSSTGRVTSFRQAGVPRIEI